jgi:hypothetical protein
MASDQQVSAQAVLRAVMRLRRQGNARTMAELEALEPDLASFIMEELALVHRDVLALAGPPRRSQRLQRRVEALALACVTALREAHYQLWQAGTAGTPLADLDRPAGDEPPAGASRPPAPD